MKKKAYKKIFLICLIVIFILVNMLVVNIQTNNTNFVFNGFLPEILTALWGFVSVVYLFVLGIMFKKHNKLKSNVMKTLDDNGDILEQFTVGDRHFFSKTNSNNKLLKKLSFKWIFIIFVLFLYLFVGAFNFFYLRLYSSGVWTNAQVVEFVYNNNNVVDDGQMDNDIVYKYFVSDIEYLSRAKTRSRYRIGDKIIIRYDKERPDISRPLNGSNLSITHIIFIVILVVEIFASLYLYFIKKYVWKVEKLNFENIQ